MFISVWPQLMLMYSEKEKGERETLHSYINFLLFNKKQYQIKNTNTLGDYPAFSPVCLVELKPTKDWEKRTKNQKNNTKQFWPEL